MKKYFFLFWAFSLNFISCCDPNAIDWVMDEFTKSNADLLNESNYWLYTNTSGNKKDSLFVSSRKEETRKHISCAKWLSIEGKISGNYISGNSNDLSFELSGRGNYTIFKNDIVDIAIKDNVIFLDSIVVGQFRYYNVLGSDNFLFVQNVGIVRYITQTDTFNLTYFKVN